MAAERKFLEQHSATEIKNLMSSGMKVASLRDASNRIFEQYEAPIKAEIGDPCLRTRYKFLDGAGGTSKKVIAWEEEVVAWQGFEIIEAGTGNDFDLVS